MKFLNKKAEASTDTVMKWIIALAVLAGAAYAFRTVFLKLG